MTCYFLESSAFAKLFVLEQGSEALIRLLEPLDDSQKFVSALASLEVRSALRRRERMREISSADVDRALGAVESECAQIAQQLVDARVVDAGKVLLDLHVLRALDALHLATCVVLRETLQDADICFVSADDALLKAAATERFPVLNPLTM